MGETVIDRAVGMDREGSDKVILGIDFVELIMKNRF